MRYWLTTHWPPREDNPDEPHSGVYVPDGRQDKVKALQKGDVVFIYESGSGEDEVLRDANNNKVLRKCIWGEQAIVTIAEVTEKLLKHSNCPVTEYAHGKTRWWCWQAPTKPITSSGQISRAQVNQIMGWKSGYNLRGLGGGSGVIEVNPKQADAFKQAFRESTDGPAHLKKQEKKSFNHHGNPTGGESPAHLALKNFVANHPEKVLKEKGLQLVGVEYSFPTGDRADVVLMDAMGRVIGLEVELDVGNKDLPGVLQALKYRVMLEPLLDSNPGEGRAVLVAYSVTPKIRELCKKYGVEVYTVPASAVKP